MDHVQTSIRERAYALWERDGRVPGRDEHYWRMAEQELAAQALAIATEAPAAVEAVAAKPVRKPAARKPATRSAAAKTVAEVAEAVAKPAPRRRRAAAGENVTTH
ncbi:DUF2934 domain-containing protein [Methylobacterium aquaticum]|uniref:DUF2934 domain-containing protein n=1 Tax=Methylobacterium aquaticum TaxID=270351 RepID=UPI0019323148|nr:DUF2934 domain-containing protein [Methylobacterium aquaticum]QRE75033.1 DUF2934 domain-containing protein [Methylobacterium aquaticum]